MVSRSCVFECAELNGSAVEIFCLRFNIENNHDKKFHKFSNYRISGTNTDKDATRCERIHVEEALFFACKTPDR